MVFPSHLLNIHQLSLVDLSDGDVVLGRDGEAPLGKQRVHVRWGPHSTARRFPTCISNPSELPAQLLTMSV